MKRTEIKKRSNKMVSKLAEYHKLIERLTSACHNRSELSGDAPTWESEWMVEPHHITGRDGDRLLDVWNVIMLTRNEHTIEQQHLPGCHTKEYLLELVREIRTRQGFKEG